MSLKGIVGCHMIVPETYSKPLFASVLWKVETLSWSLRGKRKTTWSYYLYLSSKPIFCTPSTYCLLNVCMILTWCTLSFSTSYMHIMYIKLYMFSYMYASLSFLLLCSVLVDYGYTNANICCRVDEYVDPTNVWNKWEQLRQGEERQNGYIRRNNLYLAKNNKESVWKYLEWFRSRSGWSSPWEVGLVAA